MNDTKQTSKAPLWGALIGFAVAATLSYSFILPEDVRHLHISEAKFGDWVLVGVGLVISLLCAWMGYMIGDTASEPD